MASWSEKYHGVDEETLTDWTETRKFDDEHDNEWFTSEEKKMAELYGGDFVRVKYTAQGRVGYFCEICSAECNAKVSLDSHCNGMKHLKKKTMWEKEKSSDPNGNDDEEPEYPTGPLKKWTPKENTIERPKIIEKPRELRPPAYEERYRKNPPRERSSQPNGPPYIRDYGHNTPRDLRDLVNNNRGFQQRDRSRSPVRLLPPKQELKKSPAGALLQKLSECAVKTEEDVNLGVCVITALTKSLRDHYLTKGNQKVSDLLMELELKIGAVKALSVVSKYADDEASPSLGRYCNTPLPPPAPSMHHPSGSTIQARPYTPYSADGRMNTPYSADGRMNTPYRADSRMNTPYSANSGRNTPYRGDSRRGSGRNSRNFGTPRIANRR